MDAPPLRIAVTGHRPKDLFGYDRTHEGWGWLRATLRTLVDELAAGRPVELLSGMAQGVDQEFADMGIMAGYPVAAYVPFDGQEAAWPAPAQALYRRLLRRCTRVLFISSVRSVASFFRRNERMVEDSDIVIAVWTGKAEGGTAHCVQAALDARRPMVWVDPVQRRLFHVAN
jgi:uncharacterized phage-like protein YoqJ